MSTTTYSADAPITPVKPAAIVATTEVPSDSDEIAIQAKKAVDGLAAEMVNPKMIDDTHKMLPIGPGKPWVEPHHPSHPYHPELPHNHRDIVDRITTHVVCQNWLMADVNELVEEFKVLKKDNATKEVTIKHLRRDLATARHNVKIARDERDKAIQDYQNECKDHQVTRDQLAAKVREYIVLQGKYADLEKSYRNLLNEFKNLQVLYNRALRDIVQLKDDIAFLEDRVRDLESKLKISNASEDVANKRVTELQRYIWQLERQKSELEIIKDRSEEDVRYYKRRLHDLTRRYGLGNELGIKSSEVEEEMEESHDGESSEGVENSEESEIVPENEGTVLGEGTLVD